MYIFLLSAVDQFRKQFAHLEENGGKSGPVIPLERKHVSLPRYLPARCLVHLSLFQTWFKILVAVSLLARVLNNMCIVIAAIRISV